MAPLESWITPLLLIPSAALIILSTSARYTATHSEFHRLMESVHESAKLSRARIVMRQSLLLRSALMALYAAIVMFAGSSFVMYLFQTISISVVLAGLGVAAVLIAACLLTYEAMFSCEALHNHFQLVKEARRKKNNTEQ